MNNLRLLIFLQLLIVSCTSKNTNDDKHFSLDKNTYRISISNSEDPSKEINFRSLLSDVKYTPLETDSTCFIGRCSKVYFYESKYFIIDKNLSEAHAFDISGNHLFKIGKVGDGPGEYSRIDDFDIDKTTDQFVLWSNDNRALFKYRIENGSFVEQVRLPNFGSSFSILDENHYIFYLNYNIEKEGPARNVTIIDKSGNTVRNLFQFPADKAKMSFSMSGFLKKYNDGYLYAHALSDTIFYLSKDAITFPKFIFDFGSTAWSNHFNVFDHDKFLSDAMGHSFLSRPVIGNVDFLFFTYIHDNKLKKGLYDLEYNQIYTPESF